MSLARRLLLAAALATPAGPAAAQMLRGVVLLPDATTRVPGVIIQASDSLGATAARALSSDGGAFELRLPAPGRYVLRALRIGFKPTLLPPVRIAKFDTLFVQAVLGTEVLTLASVTVKGDNVCQIREDSGQLVARLWEEARKAITATQLRTLGAPLTATWYRYERDMDSLARVVRRQTVSTTTAVTSRPFTSDPPESLAQLGYVTEVDGDLYFRAPDADALLSDSFARTHCFHVEPPHRDQPDLVGVGFRPARGRSGIHDIEGTFWLDRNSVELRYLEFQFTSMPPAYATGGAGGRVEFLRLPTGHWLVSRWYLRMPTVKVRKGMVVGQMHSDAQYVVDAIHITGGEVTEVRRDSALLHRGGGATVDVEVVSGDSLVPVSGTVVDFDGTGYTAQVDSAGRARLQHVLPGPYEVHVTSPVMAEAKMAPLVRPIAVRESGDASVVRFELPSPTVLLQQACGADVLKRKEILVFGTVRGSHAEPLAGAMVTVGWKVFQSAGGGVLRERDEFRDVTADGVGRWRLCGVPGGTLLSVQATVGGRKYEAMSVRAGAAPSWQRVSITVPPATPP